MLMHRHFTPLALGVLLNAAFAPACAEVIGAAVVPPTVVAKEFHIVGSKAFSEAELLKLVDPALGQTLTSEKLNALAESITGYYRQHGFNRARAIIPQQNFSGGTVRFIVTTAPKTTVSSSITSPPPSTPAVIKPVEFRISGSRAFTEAELLTLVSDAVGQELTLDKLDSLAERITAYYRNHGYRRARAVVHRKTYSKSNSSIVEGVVRFLVTTLPIEEVIKSKPKQAEVPASLPSYEQTPLGQGPQQVLLERAQWWAARDRVDLAMESLEKLFSILPNDPAGLILRTQLDVRRNKPKEAQSSLDELRRVQPNNADIPRLEALLRTVSQDKAELRQARSLKKSGQGEQALAIFRKLFRNGPPSDELSLEYWQLVGETAQGWKAAREGIAKLVRKNPDDQHYRLALAEHETARAPLNTQALQTIISMTKLPELSKQARQAWRRAMLNLNDVPTSLPLLINYLAVEPDDSAVREKRILIVAAQEKLRKLMANPDYRAGVEGLALLEKGQLDAADPLLVRAVRGLPNNPDFIGGIGTLRLRQGHHNLAQSHFIRAAQLAGSEGKKWSALAKTAELWQLMREARDALKLGNLSLTETKLAAVLKVDPKEASAIALLGEVQAERGLVEPAIKTYRRALSIDPVNSTALQGLLAVYVKQGVERDTQQVIAQLSPAQRKILSPSLKRMEADALEKQAEDLLAQGKTELAIERLEQATRIDNDDPWSRFTLAKLYAGQNHADQGLSLLDDLVKRHPDDLDAVSAFAQYQSSIGAPERVLDTLARIPLEKRTPKLTALWGKNLQQLAIAHANAGRKAQAVQLLQQAEEIAANDEATSLLIATAWGEIGEYAQADRVFDAVRNGQNEASVRWYLRHAEYLAAKNSPSLGAELSALAALPSLQPEEVNALYELQESYALRTAKAELDSGAPGIAHQTIAPFLQAHPERVSLLLVDARAFQAEQQWAQAQTLYARILQLDPNEADARAGLIETQLAAGNRTAALAQLDNWAANETSPSMNSSLQMLDLYRTLGETARAHEKLNTMLSSYPNQPRVLDQAWKLAQSEGRLADEITYLQQSLMAERATPAPTLTQSIVKTLNDNAAYREVGFDELGAPEKIQRNWKEKKLAALLDRRTDWLSSAVDIRNRSGTAGTSMLHAVEMPVEYKTTWHANDEVFFRTDLVKMDAGAVAANSQLFGSMALCQPLCGATTLSQTAQGVGFTAGYQSDVWRADVGVTPLNFAVSNIVGGVRYDGDWGQASYSVEATRRPLAGSVLSFAGTRDPNTGQVWGGVVSTGARVGLSLDKGDAFGFWSSAGLHSLTGRNVQTNNRLQLMAGGQWRVINEENRLLSLGVTGMYWHHTQNAGEYTFGHGGYYSPQNYRSLSLPVTFGERYPRFSYVLRAAVSVSQSQTQSALYFPTSPTLQAQAAALSPIFTASSGRGQGYSLKGAWEYQVDRPLFVGAQLSIDRSDNYSPNRALFYMRYSLDQPAAQPVSFPPLPIEPSSQL